MPTLTATLTFQNKLKGASRIAILGVGSELRSDDLAGILVAQKIKEIIKDKDKDKFKVFIGGTAPENLTGDIKKFNPSHIIIIDSADFKKEPGFMGQVELDKIGGMSFDTHRLPLKIMADYLLQSLPGVIIILLGIQPKSLAFGAPLAREVEDTVDRVSQAIYMATA